MALLEGKNLCLTLGKNAILTDINLKLSKGMRLGIVGPNGSGKTSVLSLMAGLIKPTRGKIEYLGQELRQYRRRQLARTIAFVEQQADTHDAISARQAVEIGRTPHKALFSPWTNDDEETVSQAIKKVDMQGFEQRCWTSLSGGEKQRLHIARALAQSPEILILDEPTNHLDIGHQLDLLALVHSLDVSVIMALHDLNHAAMFCDFLIILKNGKCFASGIPHEILTEKNIFDVFSAKCKIRHYNDGSIDIRYLKP